MKKFEFSLSHMRDYRERLLDEEKGTLQRLKAERDTLAEHLARLRQEFAALSHKMSEEQAEGTTITELRRLGAQLDNIRLQQRELKKLLERAETRVENQMSVVLAANREVSKLDKLQERQYEEYRYQAGKAEEDRIDEFVAQNLHRVQPALAAE